MRLPTVRILCLAAALAVPLAAPAPPAHAELADDLSELDAVSRAHRLARELDALVAELGEDHHAVKSLYDRVERLAWPRFDVSFEGGSAEDYVAAVRAASEHANIITMPGVEAFEMPPVTLTGVSIEGALAPLEFARPSDPAFAHMDDVELDIEEDGNVFVIAPEEGWPPRQEVRQAVWSLAELIDAGGLTPEAALTAVESAVEALGTGEPRIRFHPETRLLIVVAEEATLHLVDDVLDGLDESAEAAREREDEIRELDQEAAELRIELEHARRGLRVAREKLERFPESSRKDTSAYELEVSEHERMVGRLEAQLAHLTKRMEELRSRAR